MRLDPKKDREFFTSKHWNEGDLVLRVFKPKSEDGSEPGFLGNSFSGNERNRLFLQQDGNFEEVSHVSGADFREDGRGFVLLDFDNDGWLDMGVIAAQSPRFRILRNTIGDGQESPNKSVFISLIGGHEGTEPTTEWSSRDAYGSLVRVTIGDVTRAYQLNCGEGLSSQNSKWIHVGMGQAEKIDRVEVTWPSGKKTTEENVKAGSRITLLESGN